MHTHIYMYIYNVHGNRSYYYYYFFTLRRRNMLPYKGGLKWLWPLGFVSHCNNE